VPIGPMTLPSTNSLMIEIAKKVYRIHSRRHLVIKVTALLFRHVTTGPGGICSPSKFVFCPRTHPAPQI